VKEFKFETVLFPIPQDIN